MNALLLLAAVAGGFFLFSRKGGGDVVKGASGTTWKLVVVGTASGYKTFDVFLPAGSMGPHGEMRVLRYVRTSDDPRVPSVLVELDPAAQAPGMETIVALAKSDFGVK